MAAEHKAVPTAETVKSYCDGMGIGQTTFYKHVALGNIKILKIGKKTLVRTTEREAFLARIAGVAR
jgi:hypothetical protein